MACYQPLKAVQGYYADDDYMPDGWAQPKIIYPIDETSDGARIWPDDLPKKVSTYKKQFDITREIALPCGWCVGCRLDNARMWSLRMMHELRYSTNCHFITLTYADKYLPDHADLKYEHLRDFFKRARHLFQGELSPTSRRPTRHVVTPSSPAFRYFACGEYGDKTMRPHYHFCAYDFKIPDLRFFKQTKTGPYFISQALADCWQHGHVITCPLDWASAQYVSGYVTKKMNVHEGVRLISPANEDEEAEYYTIQRAFQSKGLGLRWYQEHQKEVWDLDACLYSNKYLTKVPRYYFKQLQDTDPERAEEVLIKRYEKFKDRPVLDTELDRQLQYAMVAKRLQLANSIRSL